MIHSQNKLLIIIECLKFPLSVLVVYIHGFGENFVDWNGLNSCTYEYIRGTISHVIARIAVPMFFCFSGFLFFKDIGLIAFDKNIYINKLKRRVKTLLVPYLLWNTLQILLTVSMILKGCFLGAKSFADILNYFGDKGYLEMFWNCNTWPGEVNAFGELLQNTGPILLPFWYIRDLIVMCLLAPVVYFFCKIKYSWLLLFVAYVLSVKINIFGVQMLGVFFYSAGAYVAIHGVDIINLCRKLSAVFIPLSIFLTFSGILYVEQKSPWQIVLFNMYLLIAIIAVLAITEKIVDGRTLNKSLPQMSFFVYASHPLLILYLSELLLSRLLPWGLPIIKTVNYLLAPLLATIVCCLIYIIMKRYFHSALNLLTGGRNY